MKFGNGGECICGAEVEYYDREVNGTDCITFYWQCPECHTEGRDIFDLEFAYSQVKRDKE